MSAAATLVAGALYANFVRDNRGHLIHFSECIERQGKEKQRKRRQRRTLNMQDIP